MAQPVIGLTLDSFHLHGREVRIRTSSVERVGAAHKKRNLGFIGGGAGLGEFLGGSDRPSLSRCVNLARLIICQFR